MQTKIFRSPAHLLLSFLSKYKVQVFLLGFLWLISAGLSAIQPLVMAPLVEVALGRPETPQANLDNEQVTLSDFDLNNIDQLINSILNLQDVQPWDIILLLSAIFLGLVVMATLLETIAFYVFTKVRVNTVRNLQDYVFQHMLSLSLDYFNQESSGSLVTRLERDTAASVNSLASILQSVTIVPVLLVIYGTMLIRTNLQLMLLVSGIAFAQWLIARLLRDQIRKYLVAEFDHIANVRAYLTEIFQNVRVVKSFVAEQFEQRQLSSKFEKMIPIHIQRALSRYWQDPLVALINATGNIAILLLSARELLNGNLTVVGFLLFLYVGRAIVAPISQIGQIYLNYQEMTAAATRVFGILGLQSTIKNGSKKINAFNKSISFRNVSFSYGDNAVLSEVSIDIERGKTLALVGPSGAGKSTITDLLMRFYDPNEGAIFIDDQDLREVDVDNYRSLFGVVAQENLLFNQTVAKNIAYGREDLAQSHIEVAAAIANAAEFINEMPETYETQIGDRGVRISGGQRQRIAIARAIAHEPEILILDEATSSLDTESERLVQSAIDRVIQGRTAVVIAHRLSTVIHADKIVVLQSGRVLDQGRHDELFQRCALYRRLCELQFQQAPS
ncbi:MAG: ABC transporter ATP-binding protein [Anaerolineales bacterium]|nr:ABC transporter ATP-binding protein [Anaerolineales bacterium]